MDYLKTFFNNWSLAIQALSVIALVFITFWYARRTNAMARLMAKEYSLKTRPYLNIHAGIDRMVEKELDPTILQLRFKLENVGITAIRYIMI